jgi:hypothetical protein
MDDRTKPLRPRTMSMEFEPLESHFSVPLWDAPLAHEALIARVPETAMIRARFSADLIDLLKAAGKPLDAERVRYHGFETVSLREHMRLMVYAARLLWPNDPLRIGLRRFGRGVRSSVENTTFGKVAFAGAVDAESSLRAMCDTYRVMLRYNVTFSMVSAREAHVAMRDVQYYCDSCHVGVVEGMLAAVTVAGVKLAPRVSVWMSDDCNGVFRVRW